MKKKVFFLPIIALANLQLQATHEVQELEHRRSLKMTESVTPNHKNDRQSKITKSCMLKTCAGCCCVSTVLCYAGLSYFFRGFMDDFNPPPMR